MPYCAHCGKEIIGDIDYCPECGQRIVQQNKETVATPTQAEIIDMGHNVHKSWFEKHLNWTMVITWLGTLAICSIVGLFIGFIYPTWAVSNMGTINALGFILQVSIPIPIVIWVLKKKNRSLWWLLISWTLFFLLITNRNSIQINKDFSLKSY